jgi:hypothetical protein
VDVTKPFTDVELGVVQVMFHVMHTRLEEPFKVPPLHCNDVNVNKYCFVCNAEGKWVVCGGSRIP